LGVWGYAAPVVTRYAAPVVRIDAGSTISAPQCDCDDQAQPEDVRGLGSGPGSPRRQRHAGAASYVDDFRHTIDPPTPPNV
jgi:hypothetical protein